MQDTRCVCHIDHGGQQADTSGIDNSGQPKLGHAEIVALRDFFALLDRWDHENGDTGTAHKDARAIASTPSMKIFGNPKQPPNAIVESD